MLSQGDRRSIGRVAEVIALIQRQPEQASYRASHLVDFLWEDNARLAMRAGDALEKLSRKQAELLQPHKEQFLILLRQSTQKEVRWHLALIVPRLNLNATETDQATDSLQNYLSDRSSIVRTFAMQGLADLKHHHPSLRVDVLELIRTLAKTGSPAMRARGRKLLMDLE